LYTVRDRGHSRVGGMILVFSYRVERQVSASEGQAKSQTSDLLMRPITWAGHSGAHA